VIQRHRGRRQIRDRAYDGTQCSYCANIRQADQHLVGASSPILEALLGGIVMVNASVLSGKGDPT
jgi:hypothetical protein